MGDDDNNYYECYDWALINKKSGKIIYVGRNDNEDDSYNKGVKRMNISSNINQKSQLQIEYYDCENCVVLPGLWDSHCHAYSVGH